MHESYCINSIIKERIFFILIMPGRVNLAFFYLVGENEFSFIKKSELDHPLTLQKMRQLGAVFFSFRGGFQPPQNDLRQF